MDTQAPQVTRCNSRAAVGKWVQELGDVGAVGIDFCSDPDHGDGIVLGITASNHSLVAFVKWQDDFFEDALHELFTDPSVVKVLCGVTANRLKSLRRVGLQLANYVDLAEIDRKTIKSAPKKDLATLSLETFAIELGTPPPGAWLGSPTEEQAQWLVGCANMCLKVFQANAERVPTLLRKMALPCEHCDRVFSSTKSLDLHHQAHESNASRPQHQCPQCQKHFRSRPALVQHMDVAHPSHPLPRPDTKDGLTHQFFCGECEAHFPALQALQRHHATAGHATQVWVCGWCCKRFGTRSALDMHYHVTHATPSSEQEQHQCSVCARLFTSCDALYQHQLCVGHALAEICLVCSASFPSKQGLEQHFLESKHSDYWICADCPKKFPERDALTKHESSTGHQGGSRVADVSPELASRYRQPRRQRTREEREAESKWEASQENRQVTGRRETTEHVVFPYAPVVTFASPYYLDQSFPLYSPAYPTRQAEPYLRYLGSTPAMLPGQTSPVAYLSLVPCTTFPQPNVSPANSGCESIGYEGSPGIIVGTPTKAETFVTQQTSPFHFRHFQPSTPPASPPYRLHRGPGTPEHGHPTSPVFAQFWAEATAPHDGHPSPGPVWLMTSPSTLFRPAHQMPPSPPFDLMSVIGHSPNKFETFSCTSHNPYAL